MSTGDQGTKIARAGCGAMMIGCGGLIFAAILLVLLGAASRG